MFYFWLIVLGLIFGSFVNALVWRLHEQEVLQEELAKQGKKAAASSKVTLLQKQLRERSMLHGRSMCSHCHHELALKDLVPLFSWLWLRGKCRYCHVTIQDNPGVEVMTAVLFTLSHAFWPLSVHGIGLIELIMWLGFIVAFMALAVYDLKWFILPNSIVFPLIAVAGLEVVLVALNKHDVWYAADAFFGALTLSGTFWVLFQVSGGTWIGGGDVKLAIVLGLLAGSAIQSLLLLFFASIIGTLFSIPLLLQGRKGMKLHVPFGPYLLLATVIVVLFGQSCLDWYVGLIQ